MSVSSMDIGQLQEQQDQDKETGFTAEDCELTDVTANTTETIVISKSRESSVTFYSSKFEFQARQPSWCSKSEILRSALTEKATAENSKDSELISGKSKQIELISQEFKPISSKLELEKEHATGSLKRFAPEQVETEGKKFAVGMRKASNPAFIAVQSKFEELSSCATSVGSISSNNKDISFESNSDSISSAREVGLEENSVLHNLRIKVCCSESGTELSVSSTLDYPDGSENGAMDVEHEAEISELGTSDPNSSKDLNIEANLGSIVRGADLSYSNLVQPEKLEDGARSGDKTSGKRGHNWKLSADHDFGSRGGLEKLDKDHKIGKWQNSFGSGGPEDADQKPRECNCSNSIPSYLQAMESARANDLAASSQKSIRDVRDKEIYVEKKDSLPRANGRQGSRVQRSSSRSKNPSNNK